MRYLVVIPRPENTAPVKVALRMAEEAVKAGIPTTMIYLFESRKVGRIHEFVNQNCKLDIRRIRFSDIFFIKGTIVHAHCFISNIFIGFLSCFVKINSITTVHHYFCDDLSNKYGRNIVALAGYIWCWALRRHDRVAVLSTAMRAYYAPYIGSPKLAIIHNSTDDPSGDDDNGSYIEEWVQLQRFNDQIVLAFLGRIEKVKNVINLVSQVFENQNISLIIIGDGALYLDTQHLVEQSGHSNRILFTGFSNNPFQIISKVDALILPSFSEGMPLVVLEAASMGICSILSDIEAHRELCSFGIGFVFNHLDFSDFENVAVRARQRTRDHPNEIREIWQQNFSHGFVFSKYLSLIKEI